MKHALKLTCLRISNGGLSGDKLPERIKLLAWGDNESTKGTVKVGAKTLATLSANQKARGFDRVALDFEHNTVPGTDAFKESKEPREVAAYGVPELVEGDGLYLTALTWTPKGVESARNFIDLSPTVLQDEAGEVTFLHSAALCRQGAVDGAHFYSIDSEIEDMAVSNETRWRSALIQLLRLPETATDADLDAALSVKVLTAPAVDERLTTLNADTQRALRSLTTLAADYEALKALVTGKAAADAVQGLEAKLTTLSNDWTTRFDARERDLIREQAVREGKVIPLSVEQISATPVATLREMVAKLEPTVPTNRLTPLRVNDPAATDDKAHATAIRNLAEQINSLDPKKPWSACWAEAETQLKKKE
jgi:phage I-like protein